MVSRSRSLCSSIFLFAAPLALAACQEPLQCTSASVIERLNVKLDRELRENVHFLAPHEPDRSRFDVSGFAPSGTENGALACTAKLHAVLDASRAFAQAHGFAPLRHARPLERVVRYTAHRGSWDTYVEVVGLDAPPTAEQGGEPSR